MKVIAKLRYIQSIKTLPELVDVAKIRESHMGTHSKGDANLAKTGKTTNEEHIYWL